MGLVIYRVVTDLAAKLAFFLVTVAAARQLSHEAFGLFSLATTVGWIAAIAADFGLQMHLARAVAQSPAAAPALLHRWFRVRVATAAMAVLAVVTGAPLVAPSWNVAGALVLFTAVYAANGLTEFLHYFFRGLGRSDLESTIVLCQRACLLLLGLAALRLSPPLPWLGAAMLAPAIGGLAASWLVAQRLASTPGDRVPPAPASAMSLGDVVPIGAGIVLSALYFRIDIFMIDGWLGTDAVGHYNAVFRIVEALRLAPAAVLAVLMPTMFRATSHAPLKWVASALVGGAMLATALLWTSADALIVLTYGPTYRAVAPVLQRLALSFPLMSLNYALTHQLIGWHGHRIYAALCGVALLVNIAVNAVLIPAAGLVGAAWATLVTEAVVTVGCLVAIGLMSKPVRPGRARSYQPLVTS